MLQGVAGRDEADSAGRTLANRRAFCSGARPKAFKKWRHSLGKMFLLPGSSEAVVEPSQIGCRTESSKYDFSQYRAIYSDLVRSDCTLRFFVVLHFPVAHIAIASAECG